MVDLMLCPDGPIYVQPLQHQWGEHSCDHEWHRQHHWDPGFFSLQERKEIKIPFSSHLRQTPSSPAARSGLTTTPSSRTPSSPRTIGFVGSLTMLLTSSLLEWWDSFWGPSSSGNFHSFLPFPLQYNQPSVPSRTSLVERRASTSGLWPSCSSPSSRSPSTTATTCLPCSRWEPASDGIEDNQQLTWI